MEKKSERLEVRLGYEEKQDFTEACENQGDTPSGAIRRFISGYVRRSDADVLSSAWRGAAKRRGWRPVIFVAVFGMVTAGFLWVAKQNPFMSDDAIFSARDINNDGELEYSEHGIPPRLGNTPNGVMRVLDLDASGTISRAEFVSQGRMVYALQKAEQSQSSVTKHEMTLVEFKFDKDSVKSGTYDGATINANGLDRLVIWPVEGAPTVMKGSVDIATGFDNIDIKADTVVTPN